MAKLLQNAAATKKRLRKVTEDPEPSSFLNSIVSLTTKADNEVEHDESTTLKTKRKRNNDSASGSGDKKENVIYVGHLPAEFFENEMRKFFTQFGEVRRIKLFRSQKTQRSKCYAFVEFDDDDVAKTVSETMNGYMMHDKQLVCNVIPKAKMHDGLFKRPKNQSKKPKNVVVESDITTSDE